jgi:hypothetical protein
MAAIGAGIAQGSRLWPLAALGAFTAFAAFTALAALAAGGEARAADPGSGAVCAGSGSLQFVCGAQHPEDLAHIPGTRWLIVSGFEEGAGLKLVDTESKTLEVWYQARPSQIRQDRARHGSCSAPPDVSRFNVQGINLRRNTATQYTLLATNHGGRESIEIFAIDTAPRHPTLTWRGCVLLPEGVAANSVASFGDGTILITELTRPGTTIADFVAGANTGAVYALLPGASGWNLLPGTELPGNNGLETSPDDREFYVVAFGWHAIVVYSRADTAKPLRVLTAPGFMPDNIHWDDGRLIAGGMQYDEPACGGLRKIIDGKADGMLCHRGYSIAELDPLEGRFSLIAYAEPDPAFNGVSGAVLVGNELWLSSYQADRVAHRTLPWLPATPP